MRWNEIVNESRMAPLYHNMGSEKAMVCFEKNRIFANWKHLIDGNIVTGTSFTRNPRYKHGDAPVRIAVAQDILANRNRIIPLDGEMIFRKSLAHEVGEDDYAKVRDRQVNGRLKYDRTLSEEFVVGDIYPMSKVLTKIEVIGTTRRPDLTVELVELCKEYAAKHNIPITIAEAVERNIADTYERWNDPDY